MLILPTTVLAWFSFVPAFWLLSLLVGRAGAVLRQEPSETLLEQSERLLQECEFRDWAWDERKAWDLQIVAHFSAKNRYYYYLGDYAREPGDPEWAATLLEILAQEEAERKAKEVAARLQYERDCARQKLREERWPAHEKHLEWLAQVERAGQLPVQDDEWSCYTFDGRSYRLIRDANPQDDEPFRGDCPALPAPGGRA